MHPELLYNQPLIIIVHLIFALAAIVLGAYQLLFTVKGGIRHKILGKIWLTMLMIICLSSFFIKNLMPDSAFLGFSPIHGLSVFTMFSILSAIAAIKKGNINAHAGIMKGVYFGGLLLAGMFTFYPGRLLYHVFIHP